MESTAMVVVQAVIGRRESPFMPGKGTIMKRFALVSAVMALFAPWTVANAGEKSDFALFDGTNPANTDPGALCGRSKPDDLIAGKAFTYYISVTNFGVADAEFKIIYTDGDFVRYIVPVGESFSMSQAAGGPGGFDAAIRVDADADIAGSVSAKGLGKKKIFCLSCDEGADGDIGCDAVIPN